MIIGVVGDQRNGWGGAKRTVQEAFAETLFVQISSETQWQKALGEGPFDTFLLEDTLAWTDWQQIVCTARLHFPACPVILLTHHANLPVEWVVQAMKLGLSDLVRWQDVQHLPRVLNECLAEMAARNEIERQARQIQQAHQDLQVVLDTMPIGVIVAGPDGAIRLANQRANSIMGGQVTGDVYGSEGGYSLRRTDGTSVPAHELPLPKALRGEDSRHMELVIQRSDGRRVVGLVDASPLCDAQGRVLGAVATMQDISPLRELADSPRDALQSLRQAKEELERRVEERTAALRAEIEERQRTEQALRESEGRLRLQTEHLRMLHEIDSGILSSQSSGEIAQTVAQRTQQLLGCRRVAVARYDFTAGQAELLAVAAEGETSRPTGTRTPLAAYRIPEVFRQGEIHYLPELSGEDPPGREVAEALLRDGIRSYLSVPLVVEGQLTGALSLGAVSLDGFSEEVKRMARQVAASLAVALQQARLFEQISAGQERLQALSRRLIRMQEDERAEFARSLHDEAAQSLTGLRIGLGLLLRDFDCLSAEAADRVGELRQAVDEADESLHRLMHDLRPPSLDRAGLVAALRQHIQSFERKSGLEIEFSPAKLGEERLPMEVETTLFRAVQESLTNVARHARATRVEVILKRRSDRALAIIKDNGQGFDPVEALGRSRLGLVGMRERTEILGGRVNFESSAGRGTTIFVEIPISGTKHAG